jgi:hypothetical protein
MGTPRIEVGDVLVPGSPRWSDRASISNFTYNHVGHFAEFNHAFARGVFLGGVVRRHPPSRLETSSAGVAVAPRSVHRSGSEAESSLPEM